MKKIYLYIIIMIMTACKQHEFIEQGVIGTWHPDNRKIIYKGENIQYKLKNYNTAITFNDNNTCKLPILENTSKHGEWKIINNDGLCGCKIHIKANNPIFNGVHSIYFDKYQDEELLSYKIIIKSDNLYLKGGKILLYSFDTDINNINKLVSQCGSEKECVSKNSYFP